MLEQAGWSESSENTGRIVHHYDPVFDTESLDIQSGGGRALSSKVRHLKWHYQGFRASVVS